MEHSLSANYRQKAEWYFSNARHDMLAYVPYKCRMILDVGCGTGAFGAQLKARSVCTVWGVEPNQASMQNAAANLDRVVGGPFGPSLDLPNRHFDCIIFNDVLEHVVDPDSMLQYAKTLLTDDGYIVASIPNVGHFPVVWNLIFHGTWEYTSHGILDLTHLRFYTRKSISDLFTRNSLSISTITGINAYFSMQRRDTRLWRLYTLIAWFKVAGIHDMRYLQFAIVARKR